MLAIGDGTYGSGRLDISWRRLRSRPADVVDFWVNKVGLPSDLILGSNSTRRASGEVALGQPRSYAEASGSEPLFLHVNEAGGLIPAQEIRKESLIPSGDTIAEIQAGRLRLNEADQARYDKLGSRALYFDIEQKPGAAVEGAVSLGWSIQLEAEFRSTQRSFRPALSGSRCGGAQYRVARFSQALTKRRKNSRNRHPDYGQQVPRHPGLAGRSEIL